MALKINIEDVFEWPFKFRIIIFIIIFFVALYLGYFFHLSNLNNEITTSEQKEADFQAQFRTLFNKQAGIKNEVSSLPTIQKNLQQWQNQLVTNNDFSDAINEILKIGSNNHIQFNNFKPGTEINSGSYSKVPLKVTAFGNYHDVANFVSQVANMSRIITIGDFTMTREEAKTGTSDSTAGNRVIGEFNFDIYKRKA